MDRPAVDLSLTDKQESVLGRWIEGDPDLEIAADLGVSDRAVRRLLERAMNANGCYTRGELAYYYGQQHGRERR